MKGERRSYIQDTLRVAIPSIIEHIAKEIVGSADTIMVATLGTFATAVVGINATVT